MPKPQRSPQEVDAIRERILGHALDLIVEDGFENLSMRKLGRRLGFAAKTIYNYFASKDELYLCILMKGFEQLQLYIAEAVAPQDDPWARVEAGLGAFFAFGFEQPHMYDLMFTWRVPRYHDYLGTPVEPVAAEELRIALENDALFMALLRAAVPEDTEVSDAALRFEMIQAWSHMHGYIAGVNNRLLNYMHEDPASLRQAMVARVHGQLRRAVEELIQRGRLRAVADEGGA